MKSLSLYFNVNFNFYFYFYFSLYRIHKKVSYLGVPYRTQWFSFFKTPFKGFTRFSPHGFHPRLAPYRASPYIALALLLSLSFLIPEINVWLPGEAHFPCHFFRRKPEWLVEPPPPFTYCQTLPRKKGEYFYKQWKLVLFGKQWSLLSQGKTDNWRCYWCTIVLLIIVREA